MCRGIVSSNHGPALEGELSSNNSNFSGLFVSFSLKRNGNRGGGGNKGSG